MNARLFRYTVCMAILPLSGVLLILVLQNNSAAVNLLMLLAAVMQLPTILVCKQAVEPFISPSNEVLSRMGVEYVPAAYEPGKYQKDARIAQAVMWIGPAAPVLAWLAIRFPREVTVPVLNFYTYIAPNMDLLFAAFALVLVSTLALPFWFHTARACAVFTAGSEKRRYLLRGFADKLEEEGAVSAFMKACREART